MEQRVGATNQGKPTATIHHSPAAPDSTTEKDSNGNGYKTDFSVTTRLLPSVGYGNSSTSSSTYSQSPQKQDPQTWQNVLPADQPSKYNTSQQLPWQGAAPNAYFPYPSESSLPPAQSKCYTTHPYGAGFDPIAMVGKSRKSPGDVPLHHEASYYPSDSYVHPRHDAGSFVSQQPSLVKEEHTGRTPSKEGSNSSDRDSGIASRSRSGTAEPTDHVDPNYDTEEESDEDSVQSPSSRVDKDYIDEPRKPKRTRTAFSNYQLDQLEYTFERVSQYPDVFVREDLSNRLGIKEDRIQVWFQNRRARYRKQERTGSVSFRSRYRARRLQKVIHQNQTATAATAAMYGAPISTASSLLLPSPQAIAPYMPNFTFPGALPVPGMSSTMSQPTTTKPSELSSGASAQYLPGFHTLRQTIPTLPSYMAATARNASQGVSQPSAYDTIYNNMQEQASAVTCQK